MAGFLKNLIAPPRCVGCGKRMDIFDDFGEKAFCDDCRNKWERAKRSMCNGCNRENVECICECKLIKSTRVLSLVKFGRDGICDRLIYTLKRRRNKRFFDFAADELYRRLKKEEKMFMTDFSGAIFTNVPRSVKSKNSFGFDQAELLAKSIAEKMGGDYCSLLLRRYGGKVQKKLGEEKRQQNVKNRFAFNEKVDAEGKTVILIDDVLTTGATASECIKVLRDRGVAEVLLLTIARSEKKKRKRKKGEK